MTPPEGSVTVPLMAPRKVCDFRGTTANNTNANRNKMRSFTRVFTPSKISSTLRGPGCEYFEGKTTPVVVGRNCTAVHPTTQCNMSGNDQKHPGSRKPRLEWIHFRLPGF